MKSIRKLFSIVQILSCFFLIGLGLQEIVVAGIIQLPQTGYDDDGKSDIPVWRLSDGRWYIIRSSDGSVTTTQWGTGSLNDVAVTGDYDGDGKNGIAVWRPRDGRWYIIRSSDGEVNAIQWETGDSNDLPIIENTLIYRYLEGSLY
jgi:hypothetical protein